MSYVIVMKGNKGLKIGRIKYNSKKEAENRLNELKEMGPLKAEVMKYDEAVGITC